MEALFTSAKIGRQATCPYTVEYYSPNKNGILPFMTTWMDLEGILLSEIDQTEKDKHQMIVFVCGI